MTLDEKSKIEKMKEEVFKHVDENKRIPMSPLLEPYVGGIYEKLKEELKKVKQEDPIVDENALIDFFSDIEKIHKLKSSNTELFWKIYHTTYNFKNLLNDPSNVNRNIDMLSTEEIKNNTIEDYKKLLSKIKVYQEKLDELVVERKKIGTELEILGTLKEMYVARMKMIDDAEKSFESYEEELSMKKR